MSEAKPGQADYETKVRAILTDEQERERVEGNAQGTRTAHQRSVSRGRPAGIGAMRSKKLDAGQGEASSVERP